MKGQFFLAGALAFIVMFFLFLPPKIPISSTYSEDLHFLSDNIGKEMPFAYNHGINASSPSGTLLNFTNYLYDVLDEKYVNYTSFFLTSGNLSGDDMNFTFGNMAGYNTVISLEFTSETLSVTIYAAHNSTNSTTVTPTVFPMEFTATFGSETEDLVWEQYKNNIYYYHILERGGDSVKESVSG